VSVVRENALGYQLHLVAGYIEGGLRLTEALRRVPSLLPRQIVATLAAGEQTGDIGRVLPVCRGIVSDVPSKAASTQNYIAAWPLLLSIGGAGIIYFLGEVILPKFREIYLDLLEGAPLPPLTALVFDHMPAAAGIAAVPAAVLFLVSLRETRFVSSLARIVKPLADTVACRLPWRRWRLRRDFSAMLAVLLDAGMPEAQAVTLAAQCTDNAVFTGHAAQVVERLRAGVALPEALTAFDETGEFRWRLSNAAHGRGGFRAALAGWHEALEAKAYQAEQAAAQLITTGLVVLNGVIVGVVVVAVFQALTTVVTEMSLW
jgi:type II secretory pathway component PulF